MPEAVTVPSERVMSALLQQSGTEYEKLRTVMDTCGTDLTPRDFYWAVNMAFHSAESAGYEREHARMIADLPRKWERLLVPLRDWPAGSIRWLDVGCGPGILGKVVGNILGTAVKEGVFLDPNPSMLELCKSRSKKWPFKARFVCGTVDTLCEQDPFDLITCNSVLHHIVELRSFCEQITTLLSTGGILAHCYDPRQEALADTVLARRRTIARYAHSWRSVGHRLAQGYRGLVGCPSLTTAVEQETNQHLSQTGAIREPLDIRSIWAVTDFHVPHQPGGFGRGLAQSELLSYFSGLKPREYFSYCFFGRDDLVGPFKHVEDRLFKREDTHGALFGASWLKP